MNKKRMIHKVQIVLFLLLFSSLKFYGQKTDLIVTHSNDTLICHIIKVTDGKYFIKQLSNDQWMAKVIPESEIKEAIYDQFILSDSGELQIPDSTMITGKYLLYNNINLVYVILPVRIEYLRIIPFSDNQGLQLGIGAFFIPYGPPILTGSCSIIFMGKRNSVSVGTGMANIDGWEPVINLSYKHYRKKWALGAGILMVPEYELTVPELSLGFTF